MQIKFTFALYLLLNAVPILCLGQSNKTPADENTSPQYQNVVVYPIKEGVEFDRMIAWYNTFFGASKPNHVDAKKRYALYKFNDLRVYIGSNPDSARQLTTLKRPVFYWVLPSASEVKSKRAALKAIDTRFKPRYFFKKNTIGKNKTKNKDNDFTADNFEEINQFIAIDPSGNLLGVINNPIYPPRYLINNNKK